MTLKQHVCNACLLSIAAVILFCSPLPAFTAEQLENTHDLKASAILPKELLRKKQFTIDEKVLNDGFINTYTVKSSDGTFKAHSDISLYKLTHELEAIEAMKTIQESDLFVNSFKESGAATVEGLKNLVSDPMNTIESAGEGLSSLFSRANESIFNSSPGDTEDSRLAQTLGFSNAKREIAFRFNVDVYSDNALLQEHLERLAWAEYAGGITLGVATMPIGGVAGATLSVSGTARLLGEVIATTPPAELKLKNRTKLAQMGIDANLADLFIAIPYLSPLQQTAYVMALEKMPSIKERSLPLQVALQIKDRDMARYLTAITVMFAGYAEQITPIVEFKTVARFFCGVDKNNKLLIILPADYVTLNKRLVNGITAITDSTYSGHELWIIGAASPKAEGFLKEKGWRLKQHAAKQIGFAVNKNK